MSNFVKNNLEKSKFSFERTCSAILNGRVESSAALQADIRALTGPHNEDMYALFATVLTETPNERADLSDCLNSRLLRSVLVL